MTDLAADIEKVLKENYSNPDRVAQAEKNEELVEDLVRRGAHFWFSGHSHYCSVMTPSRKSTLSC
jgi:hypothetical protein